MHSPAPTARVSRVVARCSGALAFLTAACTVPFAVSEPRLIPATTQAILLGVLSFWVASSGRPQTRPAEAKKPSLSPLGWLCAALYVIGIVVPLLGFFVFIAIGLSSATPLAVILFILGILSAFSGLRILRAAMLRSRQASGA